jgi:hypothetical protein
MDGHTEAADLRRRYALEALLAELDDQQVRNFILGNPRPPLEVEFERWLWQLGLKDSIAHAIDDGQGMEISFGFDARAEPPRTHLHSFITGITRELKPESSCGTIVYTRQGGRLIATFRFEPRRTGMDQFRRYRERRA